ncbi:helix-turn-helix domain-containing protein [Actinoplanes sp. LDG1-06]|uniref:Helix-turn-helix domain-containing protein n=1 Tax=Paractinoplanes ovalisporus TaxID=2810368 RepID=A0ABS2ATS5_9ACTN|nr:helix-turn-helix transcriptional regulator [Actinoplanes ovalisporus]MBM2623262.1 helix-turn-helix domain-containing protein [Actinoplanes ovalisporus]
MTTSPEFPDSAEEHVGAALARRRKSLKIPGQVLGERVGMSQAKISRLETGKSAADPQDVRLIAEALKMPDTEVERLAGLAERSNNQLVDWHPAELGLQNRQKRVRQLEAPVREIRTFQPAVVVGLLQTSEYARAVLDQLRTQLDDDQIADSLLTVSEAVSIRIQRSQLLYDPGRQFHFVMTETVLSNRVCGPAEMLGQIARLREVATLPNVSIRFIPREAELPIAPFHGFELMGDRTVMVDIFSASLESQGRGIVRRYRRVFDALESAATTDIEPLLDAYEKNCIRQLAQAAA